MQWRIYWIILHCQVFHHIMENAQYCTEILAVYLYGEIVFDQNTAMLSWQQPIEGRISKLVDCWFFWMFCYFTWYLKNRLSKIYSMWQNLYTYIWQVIFEIQSKCHMKFKYLWFFNRSFFVSFEIYILFKQRYHYCR